MIPEYNFIRNCLNTKKYIIYSDDTIMIIIRQAVSALQVTQCADRLV